jgi:hypothetical protein
VELIGGMMGAASVGVAEDVGAPGLGVSVAPSGLTPAAVAVGDDWAAAVPARVGNGVAVHSGGKVGRAEVGVEATVGVAGVGGKAVTVGEAGG